MNMTSGETRSYFESVPQQQERAVDELSLIEAIRDLYILALTYHGLATSREHKLEAIKIIWYLTNKWIECLAPIRYVPGVVEKLGTAIKARLWDLEYIGEDTLSHIIVGTFLLQRLRKALDIDEIASIAESVYESVKNLVTALSGGNNDLVDSIFRGGELSVDEVVMLSVATMVLSTNTQLFYSEALL